MRSDLPVVVVSAVATSTAVVNQQQVAARWSLQFEGICRRTTEKRPGKVLGSTRATIITRSTQWNVGNGFCMKIMHLVRIELVVAVVAV